MAPYGAWLVQSLIMLHLKYLSASCLNNRTGREGDHHHHMPYLCGHRRRWCPPLAARPSQPANIRHDTSSACASCLLWSTNINNDIFNSVKGVVMSHYMLCWLLYASVPGVGPQGSALRQTRVSPSSSDAHLPQLISRSCTVRRRFGMPQRAMPHTQTVTEIIKHS